jgi:dTMP kinase
MDGVLIVVEGVDGSGKTTASKALAARLGVDWQCFPDRTTPIGKVIDGYLKHEWAAGFDNLATDEEDEHLNALVFQGLQFANRLEHLDRLRQTPHRSLVLDRYWQSGYAYGKLDGLDGDYLIRASQNLPQATLNILLDLPPLESAKRMKARGAPPEHYENEGVLHKLRSYYQEVWGWGRCEQGERYWKVVNAMGSKEELQERLWNLLLETGCRR